MKNMFKEYQKALKEKNILKSVVKMVKKDQEITVGGETIITDVMVMDLQGIRGVIPKSETNFGKQWKSLVGFVNREVEFVVTEIDEVNNTVYCSRKLAQELSLPEMVERLESGEQFIGKIINFVPYGAFVEINGGVTGLLKDTSFAADYTKISDVLPKLGSEIMVKLKNIVEKDVVEFEFEAVEKYKAPTILGVSEFQPSHIVSGEIKKIISNGMFVQIAPGLDALCPISPMEEYRVGDQVKVKISKVIPEENKVRGKVIPENGTYQLM